MDVQLTKYSHGAGCGCKISPAVLDKILHSATRFPADPRLLVGNDTRDDAAVLDLGNGQALISTTDFFMPIVDDAFDFGRVAAANAISDVYAMGGRPVLAIAILGWPVEKLPAEVAQRVLEGARSICAEAGITLAGGHSIDCPEPVFGLAVNGMVPTVSIRRNSTAVAGNLLYLTKPLGVGILSTAQKKGLLSSEDAALALSTMVTLNKIGAALGGMPGVNAMTDVTGFGLLGHLAEMCEGSKLGAVIDFDEVPVIPACSRYLAAGCIPGGTGRNWASYGRKVRLSSEDQRRILADPQTSGGLLVAVDPASRAAVEALMFEHHLPLECCRPIGRLRPPGAPDTPVIEVGADE